MSDSHVIWSRAWFPEGSMLGAGEYHESEPHDGQWDDMWDRFHAGKVGDAAELSLERRLTALDMHLQHRCRSRAFDNGILFVRHTIDPDATRTGLFDRYGSMNRILRSPEKDGGLMDRIDMIMERDGSLIVTGEADGGRMELEVRLLAAYGADALNRSEWAAFKGGAFRCCGRRYGAGPDEPRRALRDTWNDPRTTRPCGYLHACGVTE